MASSGSVPPPSPKAAVEDFGLPKTRSSAALGEFKTKLSGAFGEAKQNMGEIKTKLAGALGEAKQTLGEVKGKVGQKMEEVVDVLPQLPAIPVPPSPSPQVAKRGEGKLKLNMLQETRRRDEPMYDPKGIRLSKATERLSKSNPFVLPCLRLTVCSSSPNHLLYHLLCYDDFPHPFVCIPAGNRPGIPSGNGYRIYLCLFHRLLHRDHQP